MSTYYLKQKKGGQVMLMVVIFCMAIFLIILFGIASPIINAVKMSSDLITSKRALYIADSGVEDVAYRLMNGKTVDTTESLTYDGITTTTVTANILSGKSVTSTASANSNIRVMKISLRLGTGISFYYGVQSGNGGFLLQNSSSITGNVFSSGSVVGGGNSIYGDVVSSGASGLVYGVHATGTVYAHTIGAVGQTTTIDKNAYYVNKLGTVTIGGTQNPNSPDQPISDLPISDAQITAWETQAAAGGTATCSGGTYTVSENASLGPIKIPCNLLVKSSSGVLNVTGPIWVTGNITTQTGPTIKMDPSLGGTNVAIIADNPSNQSGSGIITIGQQTVFQNSGTQGSFVFMISQNNSSEMGGSTDAIVMGQSASALVAYAAHGQISLSQSVSLKEVTAYKIILTQSANVTYDSGLPSVLFSSGPSGGYSIMGWGESQ